MSSNIFKHLHRVLRLDFKNMFSLPHKLHVAVASSERPELRVDDATRDSLKNVVELLLVQKTAVQSDHLLKIVELERQLCNSIMTSPTGSIYVIPRTQEAAHAVRDSLAKLIYSKLFDYLVTRVNQVFCFLPRRCNWLDIWFFLGHQS